MLTSLLRILMRHWDKEQTKPQPQRRESEFDKSSERLHQKMESVSEEFDREARETREWLLDHARETLTKGSDCDLIAAVFHQKGFRGNNFAPNADAMKHENDKPNVFQILSDWRTQGDWKNDLHVDEVKHAIVARTDGPEGRAKVAVEKLLCDFMRKGFKPRYHQFEQVLRFLTTTPLGSTQGLPARIGEYGASGGRTAVLKEIATRVDSPPQYTDDVRAMIDQLARRYLEIGDPHTDWTTSARDCLLAPPEVEALLKMTGRTRDSVLTQAKRRPTARLGAFVPPIPEGGYLNAVKALDAALDEMIAEFEQTGGHPAWMQNAEAYTGFFGTFTGDNAPFGWWERAREGNRPGLHFDAEQYAEMQTPGFFDGRLSLYETGKALLAEPLDDKPVSFFERTVPAVDVFTFDGNDPEGRLLEHFATLRSPRPTKACLTTASRHIDVIGVDAVGTGVCDWLSMVQPIARVLPGSPHPVYDGVLRDAPTGAIHLFNRPGDHTDTPEWVHRTALRMMALPFSFRKRELPPNQPTVREAILKDEATDRIPALTTLILMGALAVTATLQPRIPAEVIEQVAAYCYRDAGSTHNQLRSRSVGIAAVQALGQFKTKDATDALHRLRAKFPQDKSILKQIDAVLT